MVFLSSSPYFIAIKIRDILQLIIFVCIILCVCVYMCSWVFNIFHFTSIIVPKTEAEKALEILCSNWFGILVLLFILFCYRHKHKKDDTTAIAAAATAVDYGICGIIVRKYYPPYTYIVKAIESTSFFLNAVCHAMRVWSVMPQQTMFNVSEQRSYI